MLCYEEYPNTVHNYPTIGFIYAFSIHAISIGMIQNIVEQAIGHVTKCEFSHIVEFYTKIGFFGVARNYRSNYCTFSQHSF